MGFYHDSPEKRLDHTVEKVVFEEGWLKDSLDRGWFCRVSKDGLCVEDFATTKRVALRYARRAWRKANEKGYQQVHGYPRTISCE